MCFHQINPLQILMGYKGGHQLYALRGTLGLMQCCIGRNSQAQRLERNRNSFNKLLLQNLNIFI